MSTIKKLTTLVYVMGALTAGSAVHAQEAAKKADAGNDPASGWKIENGFLEFGGRVFLQKPGTGDTKGTSSSAKYNQYGYQMDPVFLKAFGYDVGAKDGSYTFQFYGKDIGLNSQALELDVDKPGQMYFGLGWSMTPNLRSNTATSLFGGIGTSRLTVPDSLVNTLNSNVVKVGGTGAAIAAATALPASSISNIQQAIKNNSNRVTLGITRDNKEVDYRWTPSEHWDVRVNYSNEHRYGLQEQGVVFGKSSSASPVAAVPMNVDDTTQNAGMIVEYSGRSPWDKKWNFKGRYNYSNYSDHYNEFVVDNPFGGLGSTSSLNTSANCVGGAGTCTGIAGLGTTPSNNSHQFMGEMGMDLPGFRNNRYMGTLQFTSMTQDQPFIPMTVNASAPAINPTTIMPRSSLNGKVETLLWNNVLSTQLTSDLKNKVSYRYYSHDNNTTPFSLNNWVLNDFADAKATSAGYAFHNALFQSYTKNTASDELTYRFGNSLTIGGETKWENISYSAYAVDSTNEYTEKLFANATPASWMTVRASDSYAWRRYDNYNWAQFLGNLGYGNMNTTVSPPTGGENSALRDYYISNRDRNSGNVYVDLNTPISGLTITPNGGFRIDNYPGPISATQAQYGLKYDHNWNVGAEADWVINSNVSTTMAYTREILSQRVMTTTYNTNMGETVHTFTGGVNYQIIPEQLSMKLGATYAFSHDNWVTRGTASDYPKQRMSFSRLDATMKYKIDTPYLKEMMIKEAFLQFGYALEFNHVKNWQNDVVQSYMYDSTVSLSNSKAMIFMGGNNPNYHAQVLMSSLVLKW